MQSSRSIVWASRRPARRLVLVLLGILFAVSVYSGTSTAQTAAGEHSQQKSPKSSPAQTEHKISPQEEQQLFHDVDEIIAFAGKDTGLPVKNEVKRRLTSREEVEAYLENNMREDKDAQRLQRSELVLKKFGLIP
ncbi:MAG: hypothetical protein ABJA69_00950, partial [Acidobacteriaceae bacterium]